MEENEYLCQIERSWEIELPQEVIETLGLGSDNSVQFYEDNERVYLEKA